MKIVEITWHDTMSFPHEGWQTVDYYKNVTTKKGMEHTSVGYLVAKHKHSIVLAQSKGPVNITEVTQIPIGCVTKFRVIK